MLIFHDKLTTAFSIKVNILIKVSVGIRCDLRDSVTIQQYKRQTDAKTVVHQHFLSTCSTKIFKIVAYIVQQD